MHIDQIQWQPLLTCAADTKTSAVLKLLDLNNSDQILLTDGGVVIGCLDRVDLDLPELAPGTAGADQSVGTFARPCTYHATPDMDVDVVLATMRRRRLPVIPIKQNFRLVGMVSQGQLAN